MIKVAIVTATRAEYCFLVPLIERLNNDEEISLDLIVTGTHLSGKYGSTVKEIEKDGFPIAHRIDILTEGNKPSDISLTMSKALAKFAKCFEEDRPDAVILSGDRTEILAIAIAAANALIPIFHLHGGEVTEGALDDSIRHAITKLSYLHFTTTEVYRKRVIQLGESPDRVFNVGSLGTENILNKQLMSEKEIRNNIGIPTGLEYVIVTFHPVTLEGDTFRKDIEELCDAMESLDELFFVITGSNADVGGEEINARMKEFSQDNDNAVFVANLGMIRYLSAVKYAKCVLGNSSSGITEAPIIGTPTVNIGNRQKGRILPKSVICCSPHKGEIVEAVKKSVNMKRRKSELFGDGNTSIKIVNIVKDYLLNNKIVMKKGFYDINYND